MPDDADCPGAAGRDLRHAARRSSRRSTRASPHPSTSRTHCVYWPDWASDAKVEVARGIRHGRQLLPLPRQLDRREARLHERRRLPDALRRHRRRRSIDIYQENTNITDEADPAYPATINALLDNALGPLGYYGAFGINIHTDYPGAPAPATTRSSRRRRRAACPLISYKQLLDWIDGRNSSTIRGLTWNAGTLTFATTVGSGCQRPPDAAPRPRARPARSARSTLRRVAGPLHRPDDQGHPVRDVRRRDRDVPGDVLVKAAAPRRAARTSRSAR